MKYYKPMQSVTVAVGFLGLVSIVAAILHLVTSDEVAFWTAVTAVATATVGGVAWYQIGEIKRQQQGWETLRACSQYDIDPVLTAANRKIREVDSDTGNYADIADEATTLLNYFTTLAIGIRQGFYVERVVREQLERVIRAHADDLFVEDHAREVDIHPEDFASLRKLLADWDASSGMKRIPASAKPRP